MKPHIIIIMVISFVLPSLSIAQNNAVLIRKTTLPNSEDKTYSPYFYVENAEKGSEPMPLKATYAKVNIAGVIADVKIVQQYVNTGKTALEAKYIFPGSTRAAVYAMQMKIGNRILNAQIKERQKARQDYEQAKTEGKTASLLEQERPNVFSMNVANILPGDTIAVELTYTEMLESTNGTYQFVYPTVVGPRYCNTPKTENQSDENVSWVENPYLTEGKAPNYNFNMDVNINSPLPLQKITSTSHSILVSYTGKQNANIQLDSSEKQGGNRDFILQYQLRGKETASGILLYKHHDENFFALMMEPPLAPTPSQINRREYIFIVDVSGSMYGFPLDVSKTLLTNLISNLNSNDKFNILTFAGGNALFESQSCAATKENQQRAKDFLNNQTGGGGTELLPALKRALSLPADSGYSRTFVIATDGYVSVEKEAFRLVRDNRNKANLFAFGIGSSVNRYIIEGLAHAGCGEPFIVTNQTEALNQGNEFVSLINSPVFTNITIDWGNMQVYDLEPKTIPDIFAKRPILIYGKYTGQPKGIIQIKGISGTKPCTLKLNLDSVTTKGNQALRYLWARNRIKYYSDYDQYYESSSQFDFSSNQVTENQEKAITDLGLKYNLLTQYTSFIAVDSLIRNKTGKLQTVTQPLPLPQGVSNYAVSETGSLGMLNGTKQIEEVVRVGYGVQKKSDVTGSVTQISSGDIASRPVVGIDQALQGKIAGVQVIGSGSPGSTGSVRIRGVGSINNSEPLYVVDGIPQSTTPYINPSEIKSISVLKDASACAIYGSRGANGVVLITTKCGKIKTQAQSKQNNYIKFKKNKTYSNVRFVVDSFIVDSTYNLKEMGLHNSNIDSCYMILQPDGKTYIFIQTRKGVNEQIKQVSSEVKSWIIKHPNCTYSINNQLNTDRRKIVLLISKNTIIQTKTIEPSETINIYGKIINDGVVEIITKQ